MKVAIHQPNYLPWIGFFQKMALSDIFVILDNVQFSRDSYTQRTMIRARDGPLWLTIPIEKAYHFKPIKDVRLPRDRKWMAKHLASVRSNFSGCGLANREFIERYYAGKYERLAEFNEAGILYLKGRLGIGSEIVRASELNLDESLRSTELLVEIIRKVGGDAYISGAGGGKYQNERVFTKNNIKLDYFKFRPFEYKQRWDGFMPYLSAIDLLFNRGEEESRGLIQKVDGREPILETIMI